MDAVFPCNSCSSFYRNPPLHRKISSPNRRNYYSNNLKCLSPRSELQMSVDVGVTDRAGTGSLAIPTHKVTVHDTQRGVVHEFLVPEVAVLAALYVSGEIRQPEALGISAELKSKGYALLCVGFPSSDIEVETQDEDEVYWLQFGRYFARGPIERDDYALELALGDE